MAFHCLYAALGEVIPDFNGLVVAGGDEIWLICARVKVDVVDAFVVGFHGKVGYWGTNGPHFDGTVKAGRDKGVGVFWVEGDIHDVVCVALVCLQIS